MSINEEHIFNAENYINKENICNIAQKINDCLYIKFGIKNLYHRMVFTAYSLVAKHYDAFVQQRMDYNTFCHSVLDCLKRTLVKIEGQDTKFRLLEEVYLEVKMNLNINSPDTMEQDHVENLISEFVDLISQISDCMDNGAWDGEDVMEIFFDTFNRYKKKSENGQVFTPDHITDFMYHLIGCTQDDKILDGACGSGAFLMRAMANIIRESDKTNVKNTWINEEPHLFGIEYDKKIFALAYANMLLHNECKMELVQMDARTQTAENWIQKYSITKVLMNPPYENKYGCMRIVKNVLDHVSDGAECAFILPDKKLEKCSKSLIKDILASHRLTMIIKLPKDLFFGVGIETSVFVFTTRVSQNKQKIFTYYIEDDGFVVVKNHGRCDVKNRWPVIKKKVLDDIRKYKNGKWINSEEHLSYQMPEQPFEIFKEDFQEKALKYLLFKNGIMGGTTALNNMVMNAIFYESDIMETDKDILIKIIKEGTEI